MTSDGTATPCETCGALVAEASTELHASWHQSVVDESKLAETFGLIEQRMRYNG